MPKSRAEKAVTGSLWMFSGIGGRQALLVVLNIILARILVPEDFAAVALVLAVLAILNTISELGVSVALVQREEITNEILDSAFTITSVLFAASSVGLFLFSSWFANYYNFSVLKSLMRIASVAFFVRGFSSFYRSLLLRDMKFRAISMGEILSTATDGSVAIFGALSGWGAHSIIWGYLAGSVVRLGIFLYLKRFLPKSAGSLSTMKEILNFGIWISLGRVLGQAAGRFDRLLLGKVVSAHALGGYDMAHRVTTILPSIITSMLDQVLLPIYSNSKNDPAIVERGYWKGLRYSAILILPFCLLVAAYARSLVWLALGTKWLFVIPIVRILSIFGALHALGGGIFASAIYASGKPILTTIINAFRVVALPVCVLVGSRWNIEGVAWGMVFYGLAGRLFNQWLLKRYLGYRFLKFFKVIALPLISNIVPVAAGFAFARIITLGGIPQVLGLTVLGGLISVSLYIVICRVTMPKESIFLFEQFKRVLRGKMSKKVRGFDKDA